MKILVLLIGMAKFKLFIPFIDCIHLRVEYVNLEWFENLSKGPIFLKTNHFDIIAPRFLFVKPPFYCSCLVKSCSIWVST